MKNFNPIPIKTYTKKELRSMYEISEDTFRLWLNDLKDQMSHYNPRCKILSPLQVKIIFDNYGIPPNWDEKAAKPL